MNPNFKNDSDLFPAIIQDWRSGVVLMLGYMNKESYEKTLAEGKVTFFSRSKGRLWTKGESSGHYLLVKSVAVDCDKDTILIQAAPLGPTCHTGSTSCFGDVKAPSFSFFSRLEDTITSRKNAPPVESYTASLFSSGLERIAQKVGEEAVEVVIASLASDKAKLNQESADLIFHLLVLLEASNSSLAEVLDVLRARHSERKGAER